MREQDRQKRQGLHRKADRFFLELIRPLNRGMNTAQNTFRLLQEELKGLTESLTFLVDEMNSWSDLPTRPSYRSGIANPILLHPDVTYAIASGHAPSIAADGKKHEHVSVYHLSRVDQEQGAAPSSRRWPYP